MVRTEKLYCGGNSDCGASQTCVAGKCVDKIGPPKPPTAEETLEDEKSDSI